MNGIVLPPTYQLPAPTPAAPADRPADVGTIRNWSPDLGSLPADVSLEPAALLDNLRSSDPQAADRLKSALDRFPAVGDCFAGFDLVAVLGRGTFGRVYLARQGELADRFVALKVSADLAGESQMLARLQHTNIVPIYSTHRIAPFQAVCMPFFGVATLAHLLHRFRGRPGVPDGGRTAVPASGRQLIDTLRVLADETEISSLGPRTGGTGPRPAGAPPVPAAEPGGTLPRGAIRPVGPLDVLREGSYPDAVCWIGARLADGLEHAHAHGILHNDLKPANVLLTDDGQPMLLDFGVSEDLRVRATTPGASIGGTLLYMSPEHLRSLRDRCPATDPRSDLYALGIILFELLTGDTPFRSPTGPLDGELPRLLAEREGPPPPLRGRNPQVSRGLEAIVRKCLEPDPARRYQSAADLRTDLELHRANRPLVHARVPLRERAQKWARRHPRLSSHLSLGAATAATLAVCVAALFALAARSERAEAAEVARQAGDDVTAARYHLAGRAAEPAALDKGVAAGRAALARYGLPEDAEWERRPAYRALPDGEREKVRARLTDACLLLARGYAARAGAGVGADGPLGEAVRANELAERIAGPAAPRAVWEQRAELLGRLGRPADAAAAAERAKAAPLATARDYYLSGVGLLADGRHRDALPLLRKAVELDPAEFPAHMSLAVCHEGLGQYADAAACYATAIALRPDHPGGYFGRATAALMLRDPARAKADLDRAAELRPDVAEVFLTRARALRDLRDYPAALRDVDAALDLGAPRVSALCVRVELRELAGDTAGAKADLAAAVGAEAADDVALVTRGKARLGTDLAGAVADFDAALARNPRSLAALQNKAHALSRLGKNGEAVRALDALLAVYPDYVPARAGRAVMHARLGNETAAVADAEDALKRDQSPANAYQLAGVYARLAAVRPGARAEALRLLAAALRNGFGHQYIEMDPDLDPIRETAEFKTILAGVRALRAGASRP